MKTLKWITRIFTLLVLLFGLLFYFGYGNPLPFINPSYSLHENLWLTIFPLMFLGLIISWKNEKLGGYLITIPLLIGFIVSIIIKTDFAIHMFIPFILGILNLITGNKKRV
jgi:hypothetical protein